MNVFDLPGRQFLVVYAALAVVTAIAARALRAFADPPPTASESTDHDPYLIACLRGGVAELIRVNIMTLVDRGLLELKGDTLHAVPGHADHARRPLERAILEACASGASVRDLVANSSVKRAAAPIRAELGARGYWAVPLIGGSRLGLYIACGGLLGLVAYHKVALALARGHTNVGFLKVLAMVACVALLFVVFPRRTELGKRTLRNMKELFAGLSSQTRAIARGGESTELAWQAAVFGVGAVSPELFPARERLFPHARKVSERSACGTSGCSGDAGSSSSSSSCSSSSCSGGSSCGGGGCGGCGGD